MREFDLLRHVYAQNAALPPSVTIPPGDDMGAVRVGGADVLVTVDQVADGVHFDLRTTPIEKIARKAITRNLSDVAAMAARPVGAVVAACLPKSFGAERAAELFDAMRRVAAEHDCALFGGDVSMWDHPLLLSVTVLAEAGGIEPVLRRGAKVGDLICVTGSLGGSLETVSLPDGRLYTHHLDFEPRLAIARTLAGSSRTRPHCMIDLSDGLARDLGHLCAPGAAGGVGAELWADKLPISLGARAAAARSGQPAWRHALSDGEDYELCFTVAPSQQAHLPAEVDGIPITIVGVITAIAVPTDHAQILLRLPDGSTQPVGDWGWEHRA